MKKLQTLLLAFTLFVGGKSLATAQAKVAHVNTAEILKTYPAYTAAQAQAKTIGENMTKTAETQYNDMIKNFEATAKKYQDESATQTDAVNQSRVKEVEKMRESIAQFQQQTQANIQKAQFEKMKPVEDTVMAAINKVANTLGYQYVIDRQALVVANGTDITAEVKKELGY